MYSRSILYIDRQQIDLEFLFTLLIEPTQQFTIINKVDIVYCMYVCYNVVHTELDPFYVLLSELNLKFFLKIYCTYTANKHSVNIVRNSYQLSILDSLNIFFGIRCKCCLMRLCCQLQYYILWACQLEIAMQPYFMQQVRKCVTYY